MATSPSSATSGREKPKLFPIRQRTGTARFHMSSQAVDFGLEDLERLTKLQAVRFMAMAMWGRRLVLVVRQRGVSKGKGASATRVAIAITESAKSVTAMACKYASAESFFMSDEDNSYARFRQLFAGHKTINHSEEYSDRKGTNNNQAESFNRRMRRGVEGIYLNASNKYLHEYASEQAWREDTRQMSTGEKLTGLFRTSLFVGQSLYWRGFHQGRHREHEVLIEGTRSAKARGRPKGWRPPVPR